jgi:hypothetical protein
VLTENREEIEIKIQDDDLTETAKDIGLLVGDEAPMSQTQFAAREAEVQRASVAAMPAGIGMEDTGEGATLVDGDEPEEDEEAEASDEEVAAAQAAPSRASSAAPELDGEAAGFGRAGALGDDVLDADVLEDEPAVEEEEIDEGYVLEDEDEELEKDEEEDEGLGPLGGGDEDY